MHPNIFAGTKIWRVNKFELEEIPEADHGSFYEGDSYIVLHMHPGPGGDSSPDKLEMDIHFWLGKESSQDEQGAAALLSVALDQAFGDRPVQHREVHGEESPEFQSIFRKHGGLMYLSGGVDSGFSHVDPDAEMKALSESPRLFHVKGSKNPTAEEVEAKATSLNEGDCFVLDAGNELFLWSGSSCNRKERATATKLMFRLYDARGAAPERVLMNEEPEHEGFWGRLGGDASDVQPASAAGSDKAADAATELYRVTEAGDDEGEGFAADKVEGSGVEGAPTKEDLEKDGVYVLVAGNKVFVWFGQKSERSLRKQYVQIGERLLGSIGRGDDTRSVGISQVKQHMESAVFKGYFVPWEKPRLFDYTSAPASGAGADEEEEADAKELLAQAAKRAERSKAAARGGDFEVESLEVLRVKGTEKEEVPEEQVGEFFSGDSYIVKAKAAGGRGRLYFWLGQDSEQIEQGAAARMSVDEAASMGSGTPQIRLLQGKEPPHFCALFGAKMVVHEGGHADEPEAPTAEKPHLYHVKGQEPSTSKAVQVEAKATNLNSGDAFVLVGPESVTVWCGSKCSEEETEVATAVAQRLGNKLEVEGLEIQAVPEGEEPDAFWESLGGKEEYTTEVPDEEAGQPPRMLHVSTNTGKLRVEEVPQYSQEDLEADDVMLLDAWSQVFVWVGPSADEEEKEGALKIVDDYVAASGTDRTGVPTVVEHAGSESAMFKALFHAWEDKAEEAFVDPYEARLAAMREEKEAKRAALEAEEEAEQAAAAAAAAREEAEAAAAAAEAADDDDREAAEAAAAEAAAAAETAAAASEQAQAAVVEAHEQFDLETK